MLGFSPEMKDIEPFAGDRLQQMEAFMKLSFEESMLVQLSGSARNEMSEGILRYLEYHLDSAVNIRSLKVLRELFQ